MDVREFQQKLTELGGLNQRGEPNLRVVRCDQELTFAYGRMIPKYFVPGGAKKTELRRFRIREINTNNLRDCTFEEAEAAWHKYEPENPLVVEVSRTVMIEPRAREGYFIEQYIPPEKIKDTPEGWEAQRFGLWYDEAKAKMVWVDKIGPFPRGGRYEGFLEAAELTDAVFEQVGHALSARNGWKQTVSDEIMARDMFREAEAREEKAIAETTEKVVDDLRPHIFRGIYMSQGNPEKMNKRTKHGRASGGTS